MEISARANQLVWEKTHYGYRTMLGSSNIYLTIYEIKDGFRCWARDMKEIKGTLDQCKDAHQQWADSLVASIAKPFVVPDIDTGENDWCYEDNRQTDGWNKCREETLNINGVKE